MADLDRDEIRRLAIDVGLAAHADEIVAVASDSMRIRTVEGDTDPLGTRFGGRPALPPGADWPRIGDRPLSFIGQIRLSDLGRFGASHGLPSGGLLSVSYDAHEQPWGFDDDPPDSWRVVWFDDASALVVPPWPDDLEADDRFDEARLTLTPEVKVPDWDSLEAEDWNWPPSASDAYDALQDALEPDGLAEHHRMFGHADQIQSEMRESSDERLLLQVDTDERTGWMWGDSGSLYFWISAADLEARAFDRVRLQLQCY